MVDGYGRAVAMHDLAVNAYNRGRPARSLNLLHRAHETLRGEAAATAVERGVLEARIMISIALAECEARSIDDGLATLEQAETIAVATGDPAVIVLLHTQRGLIHLRQGNLAEARASLDEAVNLIAHARPRDQANLLLNRGTVGLMDGQLANARTDLQRAVATAAAADLQTERFKALHNLAYLEFLAGDLPSALRLMEEAGAVTAAVSRGVWFLDRARVLVEAGLPQEADEALAHAVGILRNDRMLHDLGEALLERARCALALGDAASARSFARAAMTRFRRQGNPKWARSSELVLLQADLVTRRSAARLIGPARRLRNELERDGLRLPARTAAMIEVEACVAANDPAAAQRSLAAVGSPRRQDPITGRMHWHYANARVDAATGDTRNASRRIRRALDELARYQASFGSIDLRTASAVHGRRLAELDIRLALEGGRATSVFTAAERARAVSSRLPAVRPPDDPIAAELLTELRKNVEALRSVEQDVAASNQLLRARRELERKIVARSWTLAGSGSVVAPASVGSVRARLAERGWTMVMYVQAADTVSAVVIGSRVSLTDLGQSRPVIEFVRRARADLDVLAHPRVPAGIREAVRGSLHHSLAELDAALIGPLKLDGSLVLVSTGVLGQLPWASLPSLRGRPLVVAPSATKWLVSTDTQEAGTVTVAALAGPDLERGEAEAAAVGATWPGAEVAAGDRATTGALTASMASATVLHVAAHGVHQPENPLFSSIRMVDGPVFAHELDQNAHAPQHVVLSACEVGLATIRPGDEALGLASVLLHLGTRSVIAGVARVGDEIAAETMARYHANLAGGADSSAALAAALSDVDADVTPPFVNFGAAWSPTNLEPDSTLA